MKKNMKLMGLVCILCAGVTLAGFAAAVNASKAWGKKESLTDAAVLTEFAPQVTILSVYNTGTNDIYVGINQDTNEFEAAITAGAAVVIPTGASMTFDRPYRPINQYWRRSVTGGTNTVYSFAF